VSKQVGDIRPWTDETEVVEDKEVEEEEQVMVHVYGCSVSKQWASPRR
jgi:hypothetical protein